MADQKSGANLDLWEHAPSGLLLTSDDGTIRRVNSTFCSWVGYPRDLLVGKWRIQDLLSIGGKIFHQTHWAPLLQLQGSVAEVKVDLVSLPGERVPVLMNAIRRRYGDEYFIEFSVMVVKERNLYEKELVAARTSAEAALAARSAAEAGLKLANEELSEADRKKDEFLAVLAHELRNPLAPMRNALAVLNQMEFPNELARQMQNVITRQVHHMSRLVDDLLDVARINSGHIEIVRLPCDLRAITDDAVQTLRPIYEAKQITLFLSLPDEPVPVAGDAVRLVQVIGNLLNNAMKFTDPEGSVTVTLTAHDREAVILVKDTGIGIAEQDLPRLFGMFVQVDGSISRSQGGLGIGLMLVKYISEKHGGSTHVRSAGLGRGSEFEIRLPMAESLQSAATSDLQDTQTRRVSRRVLIVDDSEDGTVSMAEYLRFQGHVVDTAFDGESALALLGGRTFDVVVLDIGLPGLDGYEVAKHIRADGRNQSTALIALTGWGQDSDRQKSAEAGFDLHLVKPVNPRSLASAIADAKPISS